VTPPPIRVAIRTGPCQSLQQEAEQRRSRHHGRFGPETNPCLGREPLQLDAVQRDRPLVRGRDRNPPPDRFAHVAGAWLTVKPPAATDLDQQVGLARSHAGQRAVQVLDLADRGQALTPLEPAQQLARVDPVGAVNEAVLRIRDPDELGSEGVAPLELGGPVRKQAEQPPADHAGPD
jgi:hypothetical protein